MELWDLYDNNRIKTDQTMIRGTKQPDNLYHLVVHVCIFNQYNQMLIQQRQSFKEGWPNLWDISVGGSALSNETSQIAAIRETNEELGLHINLNHLHPSLTINFERGFDDIYLIEKEVDLSTLTLQYEEVQAVKWANQDEIIEMIHNNQFIPYYPSLIQLLFEMRKQLGAHQTTSLL